MLRIATRRHPRWHTRVRWRGEAGEVYQQDLHLEGLPEPFAQVSHPDVAGGRLIRVDALSHLGDRVAELELSPTREGPSRYSSVQRRRR